MHALDLTDGLITPESRVCSQHFRDGNSRNIPSIHIGEKFASAPSSETARGKRRVAREAIRIQKASTSTPLSTPRSLSPPITTPLPMTTPPPTIASPTISASPPLSTPPSLSTATFLSAESSQWSEGSSFSLIPGDCRQISCHPTPHSLQVTVDIALATQVDILMAENQKLKSELNEAKRAPFRIEFIAHSDKLVALYTGFPSYDILMSFFTFLGPAVHNLCYWGMRSSRRRRRRTKLDPLNQLCLS